MKPEVDCKKVEKREALDDESLGKLLTQPKMIAALKVKLEDEMKPSAWHAILYFSSGLRLDRMSN